MRVFQVVFPSHNCPKRSFIVPADGSTTHQQETWNRNHFNNWNCSHPRLQKTDPDKKTRSNIRSKSWSMWWPLTFWSSGQQRWPTAGWWWPPRRPAWWQTEEKLARAMSEPRTRNPRWSWSPPAALGWRSAPQPDLQRFTVFYWFYCGIQKIGRKNLPVNPKSPENVPFSCRVSFSWFWIWSSSPTPEEEK